MVVRKNDAGGSAVEPQKMEGKYERYFNETVAGGRRTFRTSDQKMEP